MVFVLGPIVHEQQKTGRAQAFHEPVEQGLRLAIDPVQVLKDRQQRLHLALAQQQTLDGIERVLAALGGVQRLPCGVLDRYVEQREEWRQQRLERAVQAKHAPEHLVAHLAMVVTVADLEVALQQIDDWQVAAGLAIGNGRRVQHEPTLHPVRVGELVHQPGFADTGLTHDGHHLATSGRGLAQPVAQMLDLGIAADEARETSQRRGL